MYTHFSSANTDRVYEISFRWYECFSPLLQLLRWNQTSQLILTDVFGLPPIRIFYIDNLGKKLKYVNIERDC